MVITGLGVLTGLGQGAPAFWEGLCQQRSALKPVQSFDASEFASSIASEVKDFSARTMVPKSYRKAVKIMSRDIQLAVGAAQLAVLDAGLITRASPEVIAEDTQTTYPADRIGCQIGAGLIAAETPELAMALATAKADDGSFSPHLWGQSAMDNLPPLWLLKYLPNMPACHVSIIHGAQGPSNTITCSEASGLLSAGESLRVIQRGSADACFSGGTESKINPMGLMRHHLGGRLAPTDPSTSAPDLIKPYDPDSPGQLIGEAAGVAIVESQTHAKQRQAKMYARLLGFGAGQSTFGNIPPLPDIQSSGTETGLVFAIQDALNEAGISPDQIDVIVPHASGIGFMDAREAQALREVFSSALTKIELITITPNVGDALAGQSSLQLTAAALALKNQQLPARINPGNPPSDLRAEQISARKASLGYALVCTNALGGQNAAMVLERL